MVSFLSVRIYPVKGPAPHVIDRIDFAPVQEEVHLSGSAYATALHFPANVRLLEVVRDEQDVRAKGRS